MKISRWKQVCRVIGVGAIANWLAVIALAQTPQEIDWPSYGNDAGGMRFSSLTQINRDTVAKLKVAWTFHTGDISNGSNGQRRSGFETTPIMVDGTLYLTTPFNRVIALDPASGAQRWAYDPQIDRSLDYGDGLINRGVATWLDELQAAKQPCRRRIFEATLDARLIALDAGTGKPCSDFGDKGQVNLRDVPGYGSRGVGEHSRGWYHMTSPPVVIDGLVIVGSAIDDNTRADMPLGVVRAFDARTGALRWSWDPIPRNASPQDAGTSKWNTGAANAWSIMTVDHDRDLVFIPTGSASPDYYGGIRKGDNKWANSVVALKASTGEFVWGFQVVHHDLWDYDVASQPTLFAWKDGSAAIAITTKMGRVFVMNRLTGALLIPVKEDLAPKSDIPGEIAAPTQPSGISTLPEGLSAADAFGTTPEDKQFCADKIAAARSEGIFTPPSVKGTIVFPGNVGGVNWGSAAYDPLRHLLITDNNRLAMWVRLIPREQYDSERNSGQNNRMKGEFARQSGTPYGMYREPLLSPKGTPCNPPPWGTVSALDLFTGKKVWEVALGSYLPNLKTGTVNLGGPIATAGGLVFAGAAADGYLRAFDANSGDELWSYKLPAGGQATPMTYSVSGKQYLVIAAGGHGKLGTSQGDYVVAFSLP